MLPPSRRKSILVTFAFNALVLLPSTASLVAAAPSPSHVQLNPKAQYPAAASAVILDSSTIKEEGSTTNVFNAEDGETLSSMYERNAWAGTEDVHSNDMAFMKEGDSVLQQQEKRFTAPEVEEEESDLEKRWPPNPKWSTSPMANVSTATRTSSSSRSMTQTRPTSTGRSVTENNGPTASDASPTASPTTRSTAASPTTSRSYTLPAPPSSTCYPAWTDTSSGAIYGAQIGNVPWRAQATSFVKRKGQYLQLDGRGFRIAGPNIYWLGLDENVNWSITYPALSRIREAMAIAVALGANTVRSHSLGISTGNSLSIWPSAYQTNAQAFNTIDYAIYAANQYGLRLIIPLTDQYQYYHGGKYDFIGWAGGDTSDGNSFYWNPAVINMFKDYIAVLLNHVNKYTGIALKDDPTIIGWETGNELGAYFLGAGAPPLNWTTNIANYLKKLAPNHLVIDGSDGLVDYSGVLQNTGMKIPNVDLVTDHFYPALDWLLSKDQGLMTDVSKNYFVGELDWTGEKGGDDLAGFYGMVEDWDSAGSMVWNVMSHDSQCCNWIYHNDGYSIYYPNGNSDDLQGKLLLLSQHWHRMRGLDPPDSLIAVACPQLPLP